MRARLFVIIISSLFSDDCSRQRLGPGKITVSQSVSCEKNYYSQFVITVNDVFTSTSARASTFITSEEVGNYNGTCGTTSTVTVLCRAAGGAAQIAGSKWRAQFTCRERRRTRTHGRHIDCSTRAVAQRTLNREPNRGPSPQHCSF